MATDKVQRHLEQIGELAGLQIMTQVLEIIRDRDEVSDNALLALDEETLYDWYEGYIGPAIDKVEKLIEPEEGL